MLIATKLFDVDLTSEWNLAEIACVGTRDILGLPDLDQCYLFLGLLGWDFSFRVPRTV